MRFFRDSMQNNLSLCQYNVRPFTSVEIDALEDYDDQVTLPGYFDLEALLDGCEDPAKAMRERATDLVRWHDALAGLLADPRLKNVGDSRDSYSPAVSRFLRDAAATYHRHRHGYEYAVTVWALGLQVPDTYPPESRDIDLANKTLKFWG